TFIASKLGKNLFNKITAKDSSYLNKAGVLVNTNPGYSLSDFIEVEPNQSYFGKGTDSRGMRFTTFFNAAKTVIAGGSDDFTTSVVATSSTRYVRVSILSTDKNTFQLERGTSATPYADYAVSQVLTGVLIDSTAIRPATITATRIADRAITPAKLASRSITAGQIAPRTITTTEVNFVQESKNLFNKKIKEVGYFLNENGVKNANATYTLTDYIPVTAGQPYFGKGSSTTGMRFVSHYGSPTEAGFIRGGSTTPTQTFTPPDGVNYVRLTIMTADTATFQLEAGTSATPYTEYGGVLRGVKVDSTGII
ncbi:hypothetical protein BWI93_24080, partial [Siphonobacter sp. BAB-5385]|uniref:hypothetical protein n=1 Tax=Siphonobacter sp. BAB-5385 TaxID=1864822 RepID=UPI000BDAF51D